MGNLGIVPELCIPPCTYYTCLVQGKMEEIFWKGYSPKGTHMSINEEIPGSLGCRGGYTIPL